MSKAAMTSGELRDFLEQMMLRYNSPSFIETDPISIPHRFTRKEDIEIAGLLAATIAWGNRVSILKNASSLMQLMDEAPYHFVCSAGKKELSACSTFVHRTFNGGDLQYFILALRHIYKKHGGLENAFAVTSDKPEEACLSAIMNFRQKFLELPHEQRLRKHVSDPGSGSSAKRLCMFLRWMVRKDNAGVDFGIWNKKASLTPARLMCPLDVHSGNTARKLGLLKRKQNDWKAVTELTGQLALLDPADPVKYDIALFGLGVFEKF